MSKTYEVVMPLIGKAWVQVQADSEEEAVTKAIEECDLELLPSSELGYELCEFNILERIVEGNVFHGSINEASASSPYGMGSEDDNENK